MVHCGFLGLRKYGFVHLGEILEWEIEIQESKEFWESSAGKPSIEDEFIEIVGNRTFAKLGKPFSMPSDICEIFLLNQKKLCPKCVEDWNRSTWRSSVYCCLFFPVYGADHWWGVIVWPDWQWLYLHLIKWPLCSMYTLEGYFLYFYFWINAYSIYLCSYIIIWQQLYIS